MTETKADAPVAKADAKADAAEAKAEAKADAAQSKATDAKAAKTGAKAETARAEALPQVGDTVRLSDGSSVLVHSVVRKVTHNTVWVQAKGGPWRNANGATILDQE